MCMTLGLYFWFVVIGADLGDYLVVGPYRTLAACEIDARSADAQYKLSECYAK